MDFRIFVEFIDSETGQKENADWIETFYTDCYSDCDEFGNSFDEYDSAQEKVTLFCEDENKLLKAIRDCAGYKALSVVTARWDYDY
jgi:hypothetical protein